MIVLITHATAIESKDKKYFIVNGLCENGEKFDAFLGEKDLEALKINPTYVPILPKEELETLFKEEIAYTMNAEYNARGRLVALTLPEIDS